MNIKFLLLIFSVQICWTFEGLDDANPSDYGLEEFDLAFLLQSEIGAKILSDCSGGVAARFISEIKGPIGFSNCPDGRSLIIKRELSDAELTKVKFFLLDFSNYAIWYKQEVGRGGIVQKKDQMDNGLVGFEFRGSKSSMFGFIRFYINFETKQCFFYSCCGKFSRIYSCSDKMVTFLKTIWGK